MFRVVFLLPKNKPPFIGVVAEGILNADLILEHSKKQYRIILEYYKPTLNLRLICQEIVTVRFYNDLQHDPEKFRSWMYMIRFAPYVNFGHVTFDSNGKLKLQTTSPGSKNFKLKIDKVELIENNTKAQDLFLRM